jgi:hypothetical protein
MNCTARELALLNSDSRFRLPVLLPNEEVRFSYSEVRFSYSLPSSRGCLRVGGRTMYSFRICGEAISYYYFMLGSVFSEEDPDCPCE